MSAAVSRVWNRVSEEQGHCWPALPHLGAHLPRSFLGHGVEGASPGPVGAGHPASSGLLRAVRLLPPLLGSPWGAELSGVGRRA